MGLKLDAVRERLRASLWFIPASGVAMVCALAALTLHVDRGGGPSTPWLGFSGSADSARSVLSTIAGSIVTLTALVFSVTIVALQLASSQYSPRVLRSFLRDRRSQVVLAAFLSTFAYTMLVLLAVRGAEGQEPFVPELSVHIAFALTAASLAFFVLYIHHIAYSIQASTILANVAEETAAAVLRLYPSIGVDAHDDDRQQSGQRQGRRIASARSGYLQAVDERRLLELAQHHDVVIEVAAQPGDFVPRGGALCFVAGDLPEPIEVKLQRSVQLGRQRTMQQDPAFGFRQLVDIAEKALSPGINDPTTAVQAIDRLYELLLLTAPRELPTSARADSTGTLRLMLPHPTWESYIRLAFDEIRQFAEGSTQVTRRLAAVLDDLLAVVPPARRGPIQEQQRLLERSAERGFSDGEDSLHARVPSAHG